jgi:[histone H3]-lysine36 N-dimethyltransferase SETMAR
MEKEFNRYYIKIRSKLGIKPVAIHQELVVALGDDAPHYTTVTRWVNEFNEGRESVEDRDRIGRPVTESTTENINRVHNIIKENCHATYDQIEAETDLSRGTIQNIIQSILKLRKVTSRWVPHELSDKNRQERVKACQENLAYYRDGPGRLSDILTGDETWIYHRNIGRKVSNASWVGEGQPPRTVVRRNRFEPKTMYIIFFRTSGLVHVDAVPWGVTIDTDYYIDNGLAPAFKAIEKQRKACGVKNIKLLHDGAKCHASKRTNNFIEDQGVKLVNHPPYSPDLAPCDFWLFDYLKRNLDSYEDEITLTKAVTKLLTDITEKEYRKTFEKWIERMELCIKNNGDYFEHLIK